MILGLFLKVFPGVSFLRSSCPIHRQISPPFPFPQDPLSNVFMTLTITMQILQTGLHFILLLLKAYRSLPITLLRALTSLL
jgi:hypothetical protein